MSLQAGASDLQHSSDLSQRGTSNRTFAVSTSVNYFLSGDRLYLDVVCCFLHNIHRSRPSNTTRIPPGSFQLVRTKRLRRHCVCRLAVCLIPTTHVNSVQETLVRQGIRFERREKFLARALLETAPASTSFMCVRGWRLDRRHGARACQRNDLRIRKETVVGAVA